jgi:hypothetical protein
MKPLVSVIAKIHSLAQTVGRNLPVLRTPIVRCIMVLIVFAILQRELAPVYFSLAVGLRNAKQIVDWKVVRMEVSAIITATGKKTT